MPAHNRPETIILVDYDDDDEEQSLRRRGSSSSLSHRRVTQHQEEEEEEEREKSGEEEDSDGSPVSDDLHMRPEWVSLDLSSIRVHVQCPICLGIIKKTRTMMDCLHRFCRLCIETSMRLGNNECPACRKHCASRRSLRDDPRFDTFIETVFDDVDKYEEEEMKSHKEEEARNKQIQESIAKISQKQSEALLKKRNKHNKASNTKAVPKYQAYTRRRGRRNEPEEYENNQNEDNGNEDSSSGDERNTRTKKRRYKKKRPPQPSPSAANSDIGGSDNEVATSHSLPMRAPELIAWGAAGTRSKGTRNNRIAKLAKYLENQKDDFEELDVNFMLVSSDEQRIPNVEQKKLSCSPQLTVEQLKEYVASHIQLLGNDVDILLVKKQPGSSNLEPSLDLSTSTMQILENQKTLVEVRAEADSYQGYLVLAYRLRKGNREVDYEEN